jgi:ABC-type branched-subunit amino acid transport system substrate-binding protein
MKKLITAAVTGVLAASFVMSACAAETIKIGGIGPITGAAAIYGNNVKNGMEIAVEDVNATNPDLQFELQFEDDEHDPEKSVNAYNTLKDWGMQLLGGTVTTSPCLAVGAEALNDNMLLLTPSASSQDVIDLGDNVFQVCFTDPNQGSASADYISEQKLGEKIGVIGLGMAGIHHATAREAEAMVREALDAGVNVLDFIPSEASAFEGYVRALSGANRQRAGIARNVNADAHRCASEISVSTRRSFRRPINRPSSIAEGAVAQRPRQ